PRQDLTEQRGWFKDREAVTESGTLLPRRHDELAVDAQDPAVFKARVQRAFEGDRDVAQAAAPSRVGVLLHVDWDRQLELVTDAEPLFVDDLAADRLLSGGGEGGGEDRLVFRKTLLDEERPRQVQIAARPCRVVAERPEMLNHGLDVGRRQGVAEGRHMAIEPADRPAFVNHGKPVAKRLRRRKRTVGEVRQIEVEADDAAGRAATVEPVTGGARELVDVLATVARWKCGGRRWRIDRLCAEGRGRSPQQQRNGDRGRCICRSHRSHRAGTLARGLRGSKTGY